MEMRKDCGTICARCPNRVSCTMSFFELSVQAENSTRQDHKREYANVERNRLGNA